MCAPHLSRKQKRNIFPAKWKHKYHSTVWNIWPLDLSCHLHPCPLALEKLDTKPKGVNRRLELFRKFIRFGDGIHPFKMFTKVSHFPLLMLCLFFLKWIQTKVLVVAIFMQIIKAEWASVRAALNVAGKEEWLAKRRQSVALFTLQQPSGSGGW